jgi:hypothetical protein
MKMPLSFHVSFCERNIGERERERERENENEKRKEREKIRIIKKANGG